MAEKKARIQLDQLDIFHHIITDLLSSNSRAFQSMVYPQPTYQVNLDTPMFYLHSSGSTGLPKAVPVPRKHLLQNMRRSKRCISRVVVGHFIGREAEQFIDIFGTKRSDTRFGAMGLPTFHSMGLILQVFFPLATSHAVAVFAPQYPSPPIVSSPKSILDVAKITKCEGLIAPPSFVEVHFFITLQSGKMLIV